MRMACVKHGFAVPGEQMVSTLIISKEKDAINIFHSSLSPKYKTAHASDIPSALSMLQKKRFDFAFIDFEILAGSEENNKYKEALQPFWDLYPTLEIVVMCNPQNLREAVRAVKAGANTYLTYPIDPEELNLIIKNILEFKIIESELDYLREQFWQVEAQEIVKTESPAMRKVFEKVRAVAPTKSTVLLIGETGTGKGVIANLIHRHSNRWNKRFISVHCGAIPDTLLESELFGHEKGAFTGADRRKLGKFEIAQGGTIFLDEIATITPSAQIKLLQILQDKTFQRVGGEEFLEADVRVIAATNTDLKSMVEDGQFRKDLYFRLNIFPIEIPLLKERRDDIPYLTKVILDRMNRLYDKEIRDVHPLVIESFQRYSWPGNIRELENLLERAYILEQSPLLNPESFPAELFESKTAAPEIAADTKLPLSLARHKAVEEFERHYLENLLRIHRGKIKDSADAAGITTRQLHKLMKKYGLKKEKFKSST
jgi:DNA-binding NtrC family response regulator